MDDKSIGKLNRYDALIQAIDFFTQKFSVEQLSHYAFEFTNDILFLNSSALFLKNGNSYDMKKSKLYGISDFNMPATPKMQRIATFHGDIVVAHFENFFNSDIIRHFDIKIVIPLIIQDLLYGFIISNGKTGESFSKDDLTIARALMRLINNSLENSRNFSSLQETNKKLDQKIFNLFSINQSARILMSVLDLQKLYSLSTDIFSELTSSKVTAFGLYDEISGKIIVRGYKDVFSSKKYYGEFELVDKNYTSYKIVFNYKDDREALKKVFVNFQTFEKLEAEYIILLVKDKILGFVTISKPVNEREYDQSLFELVESLASSTYISLKNALLFQEMNRSKAIIENKLSVLTKLNALVKNINSCSDISELCSLTIRTLNISFGIKKAFIALRENNEYVIRDFIGFIPSNRQIEMNDKWKKLNFTGMFYKFTGESNSEYFSEQLLEETGESNCLIIAPIRIDEAILEDECQPLGYIAVLQTPEVLKEEEILLIDTISSSIAPTVNHLR